MPLFKKSRPSPPAPTPLGAVTAAGSTYRVASYTDATHLTQLRQEWQRKSYDIYDTEGHLYYATNYVGAALSRIKLVAAHRPKDDGDPSRPVPITSGPVYKAVKDITSSKTGQSGLLRQLGKNIFLTGEVWMIADSSGDRTDWIAASVEELEVVGTKDVFHLRTLPGGQPRPLDPQTTLPIRIWKEHPRWSEWADAGTRSCMELLEKIVILNRAEKAIARSRLAGSGILALPQELVPPAWQNQMETDNPMHANPLWMGLAESMTAPLRDDGHPSAVVPFLLIGPAEVIKSIKYEEMSRTFDTRAAQLSIQNAIQQIANTLELPKEILLGTGEATHWTVWAIREDVFQAHIQPLVELICEALTRTYLKQALNRLTTDQLKKAGIEDPDDVIVWYDASQLIIRPDKGDKAIAAHDRFIISDDELRRELGFGVEAKPNDDEYAKRVGLKLADPKMALTGKPTELPPPTAPSQPGPGSGGSNKGKGGGGPLP